MSLRSAITIFGTLLLSALLPSGAAAQSSQQEPADSIVRLIQARSLQSIDIEGATVRKVFGVPEDPVTFLHNNTYLICDTAYWYVDLRRINAFGHVKLLQERTQLTSEQLTYLVDEDLAQFRGSLVQLQDEDNNLLRTRHLDYNTHDSVAVFAHGGALRDKDGQLIESEDGSYDSKVKIFRFTNDVNMFTDSIFVKTASLVYESDKDFATFGYATDVWKDENMLSSDDGWYDRRDSLFFFRRNVHMMNNDQEGWCDTLYYYRGSGNLRMHGNVQVSDTTRNTFSLAGKMFYVDSLSMITLCEDPAVMMKIEQEGAAPDSLWFGADTMIYRTVPRYALDESVIKASRSRLDGINVDPVGEFRKKAAVEKAQKDAKAAEEDPNSAAAAAKRREAYLASLRDKKAGVSGKAGPAPQAPESATSSPDGPAPNPSADSLSVSRDTLSIPRDSLSAVRDSLTTARDSAAVPAVEKKDSTKIGFLTALRNVRMYRQTMQVSCDSLEYNDVDSLARMYKEPVIWNETNHQYSADSIYALIRGGGMEKANLMSDSFIIIREDSLHYDQIKSTESVAYFKENRLIRYDALGGANALFYVEEKGDLATVNAKETKMLSALFKKETIDRVYYFDMAKSDAYPVCQMSREDQRLKGFNWDETKRPRSREDVTLLPFKTSQRKAYEVHPRASYKHSERYFPGYISHIRRLIAIGDSLEVVRARQKSVRDSLARMVRIDSLARADSLAKVRHLADSLSRVDSLARLDSLDKQEKLHQKAVADSVAAAVRDSAARSDSLAAAKPLTKEELKARRAEERKARQEERRKAAEEKRRQRQAALEAKWAELDRRDSLKAAQRAEKARDRARKKKLRQLEQLQKEAEREERLIQKYMEAYRKKKQKQRKPPVEPAFTSVPEQKP